jgi:hypothetical protein
MVLETVLSRDESTKGIRAVVRKEDQRPVRFGRVVSRQASSIVGSGEVMIRVARRLFREPSSERGFTIFEVLIAGLVLVVGLMFMAQFFASASTRILESDTRSLMHQVATQEIETIRSMQYQDVGTVGGQPAGAIVPLVTAVLQGRTFQISREVTYIQDPSYSGPYPASYRRATITVSLTSSSSIDPVQMTTNVAGGALGGTLDVTVSDVSGAPVSGAQLTITDNVLTPHVLINSSAVRTGTDGKIMVPGLTPDSGGGYNVQASKTGYNTAVLKQNVVVVKGLPFTVVQLIIDRVATMHLHVTDVNGVARAGVSLTVTGYTSVSPFTFSQTVTTDANGSVVLSNIRYSTTIEPYFVQRVSPSTPVLQLPNGVTMPEVDKKFLPLPAGKIPVLLDPGEEQDVYLVVP